MASILCMQFVSKSLDQTEDEEWICAVGDAIANQVALYNNMHEEKVQMWQLATVEQITL